MPVDLADDALEIVLEADRFELHGERSAFGRDCERYDELVSRRWIVLRFTWEQVMLRPAWVAKVLAQTARWRQAERGVLQAQDRGRMTHRRASEAVA